jgi:hypothetical protein
MKRKTKIFIGVLIGFAISQQLWNHYHNNQSLESVVSDLNKDCPLQVRPNIKIFRYNYLPSDTLVINYELTNLIKDSIDIDAFKQGLEPELKKDSRKKINPKLLRYSSLTSVYRYYDKNQEFLFEIAVAVRKPLPNET